MVANVYHVSGLRNGVRSEWSIFIRDASNTPRYMIIDARYSKASMDPIDIITKASNVVHERIGNQVQTRIGEGGQAFTSSITRPESTRYVKSLPDWITANDNIYWRNRINDRKFYNAEMVFSRQISISNSDFDIKNGLIWSEYVETYPFHILVLDNAVELIVSPWNNVVKVEI